MLQHCIIQFPLSNLSRGLLQGKRENCMLLGHSYLKGLQSFTRDGCLQEVVVTGGLHAFFQNHFSTWLMEKVLLLLESDNDPNISESLLVLVQ